MKKILLLIGLAFAGCTVVSHNTSVIPDGQSGTLTFDVKPTDAKIYIDGEFVGLAKYFTGKKRELRILSGEHTVQLKRDGYHDITRKVYISDTQEHFQYNMAPDESEGGRFVVRT
jgi:hypothetical protein